MAIFRAEEASSSSSASGHRYQVFLSFRGKDTRKTFTDHLYTALVQAQIHTFKDDDLERGEDITCELQKAIEESEVAVIVFSKGYASSEWCLNELVGILERKNTKGLKVVPIYYDVQPSEVRCQRRSFGEAFLVHKEIEFESDLKSKEVMKKMEKWRAALREVADLSGMVLQNEADGYESKFIQEIVKLVRRKLNPTPYPYRNLIKYIERMLLRVASNIFSYSAVNCLSLPFHTGNSFQKPTMSNHFSTLWDINQGREDWTIIVRVTRKWESININSSNGVISLDTLLLDENCDCIHASIPTYLLPELSDKVNEGKVYSVSNFKVVQNKTKFRPVDQQYMIHFLPSTIFELLEESNYRIPLHKFQFLPFEHIKSRLNDDTLLTDVIGQLTVMTDAKDHTVRRFVGTSIVKKREIHIKDCRGETMSVTLWADCANQITKELCQQNTKPLIVVVTSTSVKMFKGEIFLSTTILSKVYLNPNIPEVEELKRSVPSNCQQLTYIQTISKSIEVILNLREESNSMEMMVTCRAAINRINKDVWYYLSCTKCNKKVQKKESTFWCEHCKSGERRLTPRYKLQVEVKDDSARTTFVIFDKKVEKIIQLPISQISNDKDIFNGNADFPAVIDQLIGKTYVFQLKLNHFNLVEGRQDYTVCAIQSSDNVFSNASNLTSQQENITPHSVSTLSGIKSQSQLQSISPKSTKRKNENEAEIKFSETQPKKMKVVQEG